MGKACLSIMSLCREFGLVALQRTDKAFARIAYKNYNAHAYSAYEALSSKAYNI